MASKVMKKELITIFMVTIVWLIFISLNLAFVQGQTSFPQTTERHRELNSLIERLKDNIKNASTSIPIDEGLIKSLANSWNAKGWALENWEANGYLNSKAGEARNMTEVIYYYPTQKLIDEKDTIISYLDKQLRAFKIVEDWGIYNWYSNDSLKARVNQVRDFYNFLQNGVLIVNLRGTLSNLDTFQKNKVIRINLDSYFHDVILGELSKYGFKQVGGIPDGRIIYYSVSSPSPCVKLKSSESTKDLLGRVTSRIVLMLLDETKNNIKNANNGLESMIESLLKSYNEGYIKAQTWWESMSGVTSNGRSNANNISTFEGTHKELKEKSGKMRVTLRTLLFNILSPNCKLNNLKDLANEVVNIASSTQEFVDKTYIPKIQEISSKIKITPAKVEVTTTEQPIAVIPPIIFSEEHQGTSSFSSITPERIFDEIKNFAFKLAPTLFILLLIVGGIFYLLAPINLKNIQTGSEYIKWAVIGYFVLLVITGILAAVRGIFGGP